MPDNKKPTLIAMPANLAEMTRAEIDAWLEKQLPDTNAVLNDGGTEE